VYLQILRRGSSSNSTQGAVFTAFKLRRVLRARRMLSCAIPPATTSPLHCRGQSPSPAWVSLPPLPGSASVVQMRPHSNDCSPSLPAAQSNRPPLTPGLPGLRLFLFPAPAEGHPSTSGASLCSPQTVCHRHLAPASHTQGQLEASSGTAGEGLVGEQGLELSVRDRMEARLDRTVAARHGQTAERLPDWELLPTSLLGAILQKVCPEDQFPLRAALVCKRWL